MSQSAAPGRWLSSTLLLPPVCRAVWLPTLDCSSLATQMQNWIVKWSLTVRHSSPTTKRVSAWQYFSIEILMILKILSELPSEVGRYYRDQWNEAEYINQFLFFWLHNASVFHIGIHQYTLVRGKFYINIYFALLLRQQRHVLTPYCR